jgi:hypothetical protein
LKTAARRLQLSPKITSKQASENARVGRPARSARIRSFAELAELPNREELYRWPSGRQYRFFCRKSF